MSHEAELLQQLNGMDRRRFLQVVGASVAAFLAAEAGMSVAEAKERKATTAPVNGQHVVPPLPYAYDALEPHIDAKTMEIHHSKHHQAYIDNANRALAGRALPQSGSAEEILRNLGALPADISTTLRNNVGGHVNHAFFWQVIGPGGGGAPKGAIADAITKTFGSFEAFKTQFADAAAKRFGSGWAWLVAKDGKLSITSTANQDSPLSEGAVPLLGLDVWEHAYYLKYQNRRADYVTAFWNVVKWDQVAANLAVAK
jgi:superoxide dismutase, Fe-Mn family